MSDVKSASTEVEHYRAIALNLCAAIYSAGQAHAASLVSASQPLTEDDRACGNTDEWQSGFMGALGMVTTDCIQPLLDKHNEAVAALNIDKEAEMVDGE